MDTAPVSVSSVDRLRWLALVVLCLAQLMITLDTTIVNVALPEIQRELRFTVGGLTWIVNAFLVAFGSFLLLAGRLGDLFGRKRVFLTGVATFTAASALCGLAPTPSLLIAARFVQGTGAALQASVILAIITTEFPEPSDRARAMGIYAFVAVAGGSLGLLAGGVLTAALDWRWVFFVNLPIGVATWFVSRAVVRADAVLGQGKRIDWLGSLLITSALIALVYAIVEASGHGWLGRPTLAFGALSAALMAAFIGTEARVAQPIMPLGILRLRTLVGASALRALLGAVLYGVFFLAVLYLQNVLRYTALQTGLAFMPWTVTVATLSLTVTPRLVTRFGQAPMVVVGLLVGMAGVLLLATIGLDTAFFPTIFFGCLAMGAGIGFALTPLLAVAMVDVPADERGLGSGLTTFAQQFGAALGLAVFSAIADGDSAALEARHQLLEASLVAGYRVAFELCGATLLLAVMLGLIVLRSHPLPVSGPGWAPKRRPLAVDEPLLQTERPSA